jgi:predicted signal transduction protein with EAL and GGDEF domain
MSNSGALGSGGTTATAITEALARPFHITGCEINLSVHGGVALFPEHGGSLDGLMRAAELALESCRRSGARWRMFDPPVGLA